jgi:hypothetical protein
MEEHWLTKKITQRKPIAFRSRGRPKMKWEDEAKQDLSNENLSMGKASYK